MMLVLASQSKRRKEILKAHGYDVVVRPAYGVRETSPYLRPGSVVMHHAEKKARAVAAKVPQAVVIGADTVIYFKKKIIGKPRTMKEAVATLRSFQNKKHVVYTGVCICQAGTKRQVLFYERTTVVFKKINEATIKAYLSAIDPFDKAGAYAIQEQGHLIIKKICGSHANVIGFPIETFNKKLKAFLRGRKKQ
jgi:septum formation protein